MDKTEAALKFLPAILVSLSGLGLNRIPYIFETALILAALTVIVAATLRARQGATLTDTLFNSLIGGVLTVVPGLVLCFFLSRVTGGGAGFTFGSGTSLWTGIMTLTVFSALCFATFGIAAHYVQRLIMRSR